MAGTAVRGCPALVPAHAREIHDGIGHRPVNCILTLELRERLVNKDPNEACKIIQQETQDLRTTLEDMRDCVRYLRPAAIALDLARRTMPDVTLMDISMPKLDGIKATQIQAALRRPHLDGTVRGKARADRVAALHSSQEVERALDRSCRGAD